MRWFARLLLLVSVLIMPVGMGTAAAAFVPASGHHGMSVAGHTQHCPDRAGHEPRDGLATCSMACASALPAQDAVRADRPMPIAQSLVPMPGQPLAGIHPETENPPPKFA